MCTVSWLHGPAGYDVFFNRDERPSRATGLAPMPGESGGVRWLAPRDSEAMGTWIGANEFGITLALANRYGESPAHDPPEGKWVSRGHLVLSLLGLRTIEKLTGTLGKPRTLKPLMTAEADLTLAEVPLTRYRPFTLLGFAPERPVTLLAWDGVSLNRASVDAPGHVLSSSGADQDAAARLRSALFEEAARRGPLTPEAMEALHRGHEPERGPLSICMHRPEAGTVSFTRVRVSPDQVELHYVPGPPCVTTERITATLPLV